MAVFGGDELVRFRVDQPPAEPGRNHVIWTAPGSLPSAVVALESRWAGMRQVTSLADVAGPWGALMWDAETSQYVLATDTLGVHPVFWARASSGDIVAGSWLAQVVDQPDVSEALDYEAILLRATPVAMGDQSLHRTRFQVVEQVPWGRVRTFPKLGDGRYVRYWSPLGVAEIDVDVDAAAALLRDRLEASVRRSLDDGLPTGAHISGGLDCSSIAIKAQQILRSRGDSLVAGYSWSPSPEAFASVEADERPRVLAAAEAAEVPMRWVDANDIGDWYLQRDVNRYPHGTHRWERSVLPQAQADGVRVLLSGWGGDEAASFNGRGAVADLLRRRAFTQAWRMAGVDPVHGRGRQRLRGVKELQGAAAAVVLPSRLDARTRRAVARSEQLLRAESSMVADCFVAGWERQRALRTVRDIQLELVMQGHLQYRTMAWYQTGRLFDIAYRYPMLDKDLVTTALSLPPGVFRSAQWSRLVFRKAVAPWTPSVVVWHRPKFEPAMLHPDSPRRAVAPPRQGAPDEQAAHMLAVASQVSSLLGDDADS